jgi:hypothetical protein
MQKAITVAAAAVAIVAAVAVAEKFSPKPSTTGLGVARAAAPMLPFDLMVARQDLPVADWGEPF